MRDPNRLYNFYNELCRIHIEYFPDWRFGQFVSNFIMWVNCTSGRDLFFSEEDEMLKLLKEYVGEVKGDNKNV